MTKIQSENGYQLLRSFDVSNSSKEQLALMEEGVDEMLSVLQECAEANYHVLTSVVSSSGVEPFMEWSHYPDSDVHDPGNGSIWFYHAHAQEENEERPWDEHGHFHLFVYSDFVKDGIEPIAVPKNGDPEKGGLTHLVAISFNNAGLPTRIFTTNRWVADEWLYPADAVIPLVDRFRIEKQKGKDSDEYSLTSRWLAACLKLYRPQIEWALKARDEKIAEIRSKVENFAEDQDYEVLSAVEFDLGQQIDAIESASDAA